MKKPATILIESGAKQIKNNAVVRGDMNGSEKKDQLSLFSVAVFGTKVMFELSGNTPLKTYKEQFYKWINSTGITVQNRPPRLRLIFYALNEVLKGRNEKLEHDIENRKPDLDPDSPKYQKWVEYAFQKAFENLGKEPKWEEMKGDAEKGRNVFQEILNSVSPAEYENFYWCPQKEEIPTDKSPAAQAALQQLKNLLDEAEVEVNKKYENRSVIEKIIQQLEQFRNNSTAHEGKNKYAWAKLNGSDKLASLKISLKLRDFREKTPPSKNSKTNNSVKYWVWIGGILIVFLLGLILFIFIKLKKRGNKE